MFGGPVLEFMGNTALITVGSTLLALALGVPAAYAMAFYRTKRTDGSMLWMMSTRMLPPAGVIVPLFVLFRDLSLLDTHLGRILLPGLAATALLALIFAWNEFFFAVNLTTREASPLSVYVSTFKAAPGDLFVAKVPAAATAAVIPVIVAGWVAQRQLVTGLTMGAVK